MEYARDHFTGASGGTIYEGDAFPEEYYGNIFTGDVAGSLVHRDILRLNDTVPYFTAQRTTHEKDKEFLAVTDSWFRPVTFSVGPDGYLYIIDMYRKHIEDPISIPEDLHVDIDFKAGNKYGRIYRVVPQDMGSYKKITVNLRNATSLNLVALLSHQNQWWRLQAHRLLLDRQDKTVIPAVKDLFNQSKDARFRLHALYVLEGMDALEAATLKTAMKDPSPGVRENAAILSERFPGCRPQLDAMVNDTTIRVAYQATLSVGQFNDNAAVYALAKSLELHGESSWFRTAVLSSEAGSGIALLKTLETNSFFKKFEPWKSTFLETYADVIGARNDKSEILSLLNNVSQSFIAHTGNFQQASIKGLIKGLSRSENLDTSLEKKLKAVSTESDSDIGKAILDLKQFLHNSN